MQKFLKKNLIVVLLAVLVVAFTAVSSLGLGTVSMPGTYYQMGKFDTSSCYDAVCITLTLKDDQKVDSAWLNLGDSSASQVSIYFYAASATGESFKTSSNCGLGVKTYSSLEKTSGSWKMLGKIEDGTYEVTGYTCFIVMSKNTVKINEVVFVGDDGNIIEASVYRAGSKSSTTASTTSDTLFKVDDANATAAAKSVLDEQGKFDKSKIDKDTLIYNNDSRAEFTEREAYSLESVRSTIDGSGYYLDSTVNPLGTYILAFGTLIFGQNTFGMRIMPFLFTVATIILLFFVGNALFNKKWLGLLFSALFAFGGFALSLGTLGIADAAFIFFAVLSFYFTFLFYKNGISLKRRTRSLMNLLVGGIAFALSLAIKTQALYLGVVLVIILICGFIKQYKAFKSKFISVEGDKEAEEKVKAIYKSKFAPSLAVTVLGYILASLVAVLLCYLAAYNAYSTFYNAENVVLYTIKAFFGGLTASVTTSFSAANTVSVFGWLVNYSAEAFSATKFVFGNIVLCAISMFSFVYLILYTIMLVIEGRKKELDKSLKSTLFVPFGFLASAFIFTYLLNLIGGSGGIGGFALSNIFYCGFIVLFVSLFFKEKQKPLFNIGKTAISLNIILVSVVLVATAVVFALAVPALTGITASNSLFSWNILGGLKV